MVADVNVDVHDEGNKMLISIMLIQTALVVIMLVMISH